MWDFGFTSIGCKLMFDSKRPCTARCFVSLHFMDRLSKLAGRFDTNIRENNKLKKNENFWNPKILKIFVKFSDFSKMLDFSDFRHFSFFEKKFFFRAFQNRFSPWWKNIFHSDFFVVPNLYLYWRKGPSRAPRKRSALAHKSKHKKTFFRTNWHIISCF